MTHIDGSFPLMPAEGQAVLTWGGVLIMPAKTHWTMAGEKNPMAVISLGAKTLTLSCPNATVILVK